ncbi:MAG TPA: hypothetical protein VGM88_06325 [Kofleriaceae bacterium]|jgi:hypothetical protein
MKTLLLALPILFGGSIARAEVVTNSADPAIVAQLHDDSARAAYHAERATLAARDVYEAHLRTSIAKAHWDAAVAKGHARKAGEWAQIHFRDLQDVYATEWRLAQEEYARDMAVKAFDADRVALEQDRDRNRG